jgi:hypothetical protein
MGAVLAGKGAGGILPRRAARVQHDYRVQRGQDLRDAVDNYAKIEEAGAVPFIPFKTNHTGASGVFYPH